MTVEGGEQEPVSALVRNSLQLPPEIVGSPETSDLAEEKFNPSSDSSEVTVPVGSSDPPEREGISPRRLAIIVLGLCTTIFLTAMEQTIVSTAVPTIVNDLGDASGYTWIGTAYLLARFVSSMRLLTSVPFCYLCTEKHQIYGVESRFCSFQLDFSN
jgi:hypothetical protein